MSPAKPIDHFERFISEMRADSEFARFADETKQALQAVDLEADGNDHGAALFVGLDWVMAQPKPVRDKIDVLRRLFALEGKVHIASIRAFAGW